VEREREQGHEEQPLLHPNMAGVHRQQEECRRSLSIDLEGALAGVLALTTNDKRPLAGGGLSEITLVAGARNYLHRTSMAWVRPCRSAYNHQRP
jgi:hypothetical protein